MTSAQASLTLVEELPASLVESVIQQLRAGQDPRMANPGYQARVDHFIRIGSPNPPELASMLEVALAAKRSHQSAELVWTGPATSVVPVRRTEQVLFDLIQRAEHRLTVMSFGIFQVPRLVQALAQAVARNVILRVVLGDREAQSDWAIERQRHQLGVLINDKASLYWWPHERRLRDPAGCAGLMHAKAAVADSRTAFLTSANLTEAALDRNMELGVPIRSENVPISIERLVDALLDSGELQSL